jgi:uncharacterized membrane protein
MGETSKVSAYPQLASYHLNVPLMKEAQNDNKYKVWVKKSMTKREDKTLLQKVYQASSTFVVGVAFVFWLVVVVVACVAIVVVVAHVVVVAVVVVVDDDVAADVLFLLQ